MGYHLEISPKGGTASLNKDLTANVFALRKPARLVIDIPNFVSKEANNVILENTSDILSIRTGVHPEKTRIVFDLTNEISPQYDVGPNASGSALVVRFALSESIRSSNKEAPNKESAHSPPPATVIKRTPGKTVTQPLESKRLASKPAINPQKVPTIIKEKDTFVMRENTRVDRPKKITRESQPLPPCLLYTSPSPRDATLSRMPSSA